jgi:hypothetical protein
MNKNLKNYCKHTQEETLVAYVWNICNIQINTLAIIRKKYRWNIRNIPLQHTCTTIAIYTTFWSTFATFIWNNFKIPLKHPKHLKQMLITCVFSTSQYLAACEMEAHRHVELTSVWSSPETAMPSPPSTRWIPPTTRLVRPLRGIVGSTCSSLHPLQPALQSPHH